MPPKTEESGGIIQAILRFLGFGKGRKTEKTPVSGMGQRLGNMMKYSWRGIIGWIFPIIYVPLMWDRDDHARKVQIMWVVMFWFMIIRPVNVPVTGLIPVFFLPMTGVYSTVATCACYMSENIFLYLMGNILVLILNNSGVDRRMMLSMICGGDDISQYTVKKLVYKCSLTAFIMSFLCNRLLVSAALTEYMTTALISAEGKFGSGKDEPNLREVRYTINNAIQVSASLGSSVIIHTGYGVLAFKSIICEMGYAYGKTAEFPDIFNYLQYTAFALPLAVVTFIVNLAYFNYLAGGKEMSAACRTHIQKHIRAHQSKLPSSLTLHEKLSILFLVVTLFCMYYRWSDWLGGWSSYSQHTELKFRGVPLPAIKDGTVAAVFVILLHTLPMGFNFTKYFASMKRGELPPPKMESGILWWKFSDKNLNYSYFFLIGSANALIMAIIKSGLNPFIAESALGKIFTGSSWNVSVLLTLFIGAFFFSVVPETAGLCVYLPFILALSATGPVPWPTHVYLPALGLGILSNYGFMYPFRYSPAYNCHYIGKTPIKMMIKHGFGSIIISFVLCYLAVAFIAPKMWDPDNTGVPVSTAETTPAPPPAEE